MKVKTTFKIGKIFFDTKFVDKQIKEALAESGEQMQQDYQATTASWERQPDFYKTVEKVGRVWRLRVGTENEIYLYVDLGTGAAAGNRPDWYPIAVTPGKNTLAYQADFEPKTTPGVLSSSGGGKSGDWVFRKEVHHPGVRPRRFTETIAEIRIPELYENLVERLGDVSRSATSRE